MATYSSKNGKVCKFVTPTETAIPEARNWQFEHKSDLKAYASSNTSGKMRRIAGHEDATGSFTVYGDDTTRLETLLAPGTTYTLRFYVNTTAYWAIVAKIASISPEVAIEGGDPVAYTVNWELDGSITPPT